MTPEYQEVEIANRIAAGWAAFHKHKSELCCKLYRLRDRIKLFEAVVTPAVLYACSTWTLTKALETKLSVARWKMLRYVFRIFRKKLGSDAEEEWVSFLQRAARTVELLSEKHKMQDWVETSLRRKWQLAGRLAVASDDRWSRLVLEWRPNIGYGRLPGRPATRWTDQLECFAGGDWQSVATDRQLWRLLQEAFVDYCRSE